MSCHFDYYLGCQRTLPNLLINNGSSTPAVALQHQQPAYRIHLPDLRPDIGRAQEAQASRRCRTGHCVLPLQQVQGRCGPAHTRRRLHPGRKRRECRLPRGNVRREGGPGQGHNGGSPWLQGHRRGDRYLAACEPLWNVSAVVSGPLLSCVGK